MIRELERFQCREDQYEAEVVSPRQTSTPVKNGSRQIGESRDRSIISELLEAQGRPLHHRTPENQPKCIILSSQDLPGFFLPAAGQLYPDSAIYMGPGSKFPRI